MPDALKLGKTENIRQQLAATREQYLTAKIKTNIRHNPVASDIGECDRQIAYGVTDWDKRSLQDTHLQARFEIGNQREKEIIIELLNMNFKITDQQQKFQVKAKDGSVLVSGAIDGKLIDNGNRIPFEIKSLHPLVWQQIDDIEDLNKKPWLRRYVRQMQIYLYANNEEEGLLILDDCLGHWHNKILTVPLDYAETEVILRRLEKINEHLRANTLPDRMLYSAEVCGKCPFSHLCLPVEEIGKTGEVLTDPELLAELDRWAETKEVAEEHEELDKKIKAILQGKPETVIGEPTRYVARSTERERESYDVKMLPNDLLEKVKKTTKYWVTKIEKII